MKATLQLPIQQYRRCIAEQHNRTHRFRNSQQVQPALSELANSQTRKVPKSVCILSALYASSVLSTMFFGENTAETLPVNKGEGGDVSLQSSVQHAISKVYSAAKQSTEKLYFYDPLVFPGADGAAHPVRPPVSWFRPHAAALIPRTPAFTPPLDTDDVKIEKIDFSCIEERAELSISGVLRKIAETLQHPTTEMTRESQILRYYAQNRPCPTDEEVNTVTEITGDIDRIISQLVDLFPPFTEIQLMQRIVAPVMRMIADDMENNKISEADIEDIHDEILSFSKSLVDSVIQDDSGFATDENLKIPNGVSFQDGNFHVKIGDSRLPLTHNNDGFFVKQNGKTRAIRYHENEQV